MFRTFDKAVLPALLTLLLIGCQPEMESAVEIDPATPTAISTIQGDGPRSPLLGRAVSTRGVVSGNFVGGLGGFFLASLPEDEDDDPATSEGVFVVWPPAAGQRPRVGDLLEVQGRVVEIGPDSASLTALDEVDWRRVGAAPPPRVELHEPPADPAGWEALEGMRLAIRAPLAVSGHYGLWQFGELLAAFGEPLVQPTEIAEPGPEASAVAADNARRALLIADGSQRRGLDRVWYLPAPPSPAAPFRVGSLLHGVEGVLDQRHGRYRLQLVEPLVKVEQAPRPAPPEVPGTVRVAALNLLNLFNGDGQGGGFPTARGAETFERYRRQRDRLVAQIRALDPDVAALMEVENDGFGPDSALAELVEALRQGGDGADWRFADIGHGPGGDAIRVALIHRADRIEAVGGPATLVTGPFTVGSRPPLAQAYRAGDGPTFTVAVNHFKSKGGCDRAEGDDRDQGDGQGCFNAQRTAAAAALSAWLADDPVASGSDMALIVGDLNAYSQEDPLRRLRRDGWRSVPAGPDGGFSYIYEGRAGRLDHALVSPTLLPRVRGAEYWAANAEEHVGFDYKNDDNVHVWAASDHNPLLLGLDLRGPASAE